MKFRLFTGLTAALCVLLASCYPYQENPKQKKANQATQKLTPAQVKQQEELAAKKKQEEELKQTQETPGQTVTPPPNPATTQPPSTTPPFLCATPSMYP